MGIFSVLFGAGIALLYERFKSEPNAEKQRGGGTIYIRLFVLLMFGYLHMIYLWSGDVLMIYAAWGMFLFPFIGASKKGLMVLFVILYSIVVLSVLGTRFEPENLPVMAYEQLKGLYLPTAAQVEQIVNIYHGTRADITHFESSLTINGKEPKLEVFIILVMETFFRFI